MEMYPEQKAPLMGTPQPPACPPSYDQATTGQPGYPTQPGCPPQPGYPTQPGYPPAGYPQATQQYGVPPVQYVQQPMQPPQPMHGVQAIPIAVMEKNSVVTVCSNCHQNVQTQVNSSINGFGIGWVIYPICCCWPFAFFVMCMDHFKTWKHTCASCGTLLNEFTPEKSGGVCAGLVCAVITNLILAVCFALGKLTVANMDSNDFY